MTPLVVLAGRPKNRLSNCPHTVRYEILKSTPPNQHVVWASLYYLYICAPYPPKPFRGHHHNQHLKLIGLPGHCLPSNIEIFIRQFALFTRARCLILGDNYTQHSDASPPPVNRQVLLLQLS